MIPTQEMVPYPVFGDNATKVKPDDPKYAAGFDPGNVLPAEWLNWLLNRASGAVTKLNAGALSMEQEINNVLEAGAQTPDAEETNQLITAIAYLINQAVLTEQQKPAVGVPTLWMGPKPDWALDFGNGASTKYLWANYPKLNNTKFKGILTTLSTAGWMTAYNSTGFYVPDLRGIVPISYGTNALASRKESTYYYPNGGSTVGTYSHSENAHHNHDKGTFRIYNGYFKLRDNVFYGSSSVAAIGQFFMSRDNVSSEYINIQGNSSGWRYNFDTNNGGTWEGSTGENGGIAKPATIACMWIVRYE